MNTRREDRLYLLWVAYYTSPYAGGKRKGWEEFLTESTQISEPPKTKSTGLGKITGVDLAQSHKRK